MDRYLLELNPETTKRLERLKSYPEEPYDQVINRLMDSRESNVSLTRGEVEEIREALRRMKEGQAPGQENVTAFFTQDQAAPQPAMEDPKAAKDIEQAVKDMEQAVKDMEMIFSGAVRRAHDRELTESGPFDTDPGDIHEVDPYDKRGRARTPHLDSL